MACRHMSREILDLVGPGTASLTTLSLVLLA